MMESLICTEKLLEGLASYDHSFNFAGISIRTDSQSSVPIVQLEDTLSGDAFKSSEAVCSVVHRELLRFKNEYF